MTQPPPSSPPPNAPKKKELGDLGAPQLIFDTVVGPNLRLRDNLIQLVSCVAGAILGIPVGLLLINDTFAAIMIGALCGLFAGVLLSGAVLGVYRFVKGVKR